MAGKFLPAILNSTECLINEILVKPKDLHITASELIQSAKRIKSVLTTVDQIIMQLDTSQFEGSRASSILARYRKMKDRIMGWPAIVERFSQDLDSTASLFEQADRSG